MVKSSELHEHPDFESSEDAATVIERSTKMDAEMYGHNSIQAGDSDSSYGAKTADRGRDRCRQQLFQFPVVS